MTGMHTRECEKEIKQVTLTHKAVYKRCRNNDGCAHKRVREEVAIGFNT